VPSKALLDRLGLDVGELVERHERVQAGVDYSTFASDPVGFISGVLEGDPWSVQGEIAEAVRDHPLTVVRSCNAAGKDWIAGQVALWWVYARDGLVLLTGPTARQVEEIVMGEVGRSFHRAKLPGELYRRALRVDGDEARGVLAFTSSESSRLTGHHAPRVLAIITEAQGVEDFAFEGMLSCATGDEDRILAVGNPLNPSGRFYEVSRAKHWKSFRISAEQCPNVIEGRTVIPGGVTREFGKRLKAEYGEESPIVQARWDGEFPEQGESALIKRSWIDAAVSRWPDAMGLLDLQQRRGRDLPEPVVACDIARHGPDSTVMCVRRGRTVEKFISWHGADTMETVERIRGEAAQFGVRPRTSHAPAWGELVVDMVGLGAGVGDRLKELGYRVREHVGGFKPGKKDRFFNGRAESFWTLRDRLEAGTINLPKDEALEEELLAISWRATPSGLVQLESKEDMKRVLGRSPDRADALAMAFYRSGPRLSWGKIRRGTA
jgi:hypothetical protein